MKHIDVYRQAYSLRKQPETSAYFTGLGSQVLAWTADYAHAVCDLHADVDSETVCVWFQQGKMIHKIHRVDGMWEMAEVSVGRIPLVNNNPFK